jgi:hypothetical protein
MKRRPFILGIALALSPGAVSPLRAIIVTSPSIASSAPPFNASFDAANTVDNTQAEYASLGQGVDTFIEYSFPVPTTFDKIVVMNRDSAGQSDLIANFTLTFNGGPTASVTRTPMRGTSQIHSVGNHTATTVRLDVDTVGVGDAFNNTGAMEVIFVRTPAGSTPISGVTVIGSATPFDPSFDATNAIDGDVGRTSGAAADRPEYASQGQGTNAFVDFDLGATLPVGAFDWFDRPHNADRVAGFDLIFSQNPTFGDAGDIVRSYANSAMALGDTFAPILARYVRYDVTALGGPGVNTGLSEIAFYQIPEPTIAGLAGFGWFGLILRRRRQGS